jgi:hypothetical protein
MRVRPRARGPHGHPSRPLTASAFTLGSPGPYPCVVELDTSGWSAEGDFTQQLIEIVSAMPEVDFLRVEDAPASRADAGFSFISNEMFVSFSSIRRSHARRVLGFLPVRRWRDEQLMTLAGLEAAFTGLPDVGPPDYADEGMLQYLRTQRIIPAYQTRGYKLVELVRIYEAGTRARA